MMWIGTIFSRPSPRHVKKPAGRFTRIALMRTHYHLVLETPNANLVAGMAWLQSTYTIRLNHRHKLIGHVLSGRYKGDRIKGWPITANWNSRRNSAACV